MIESVKIRTGGIQFFGNGNDIKASKVIKGQTTYDTTKSFAAKIAITTILYDAFSNSLHEHQKNVNEHQKNVQSQILVSRRFYQVRGILSPDHFKLVFNASRRFIMQSVLSRETEGGKVVMVSLTMSLSFSRNFFRKMWHFIKRYDTIL